MDRTRYFCCPSTEDTINGVRPFEDVRHRRCYIEGNAKEEVLAGGALRTPIRQASHRKHWQKTL